MSSFDASLGFGAGYVCYRLVFQGDDDDIWGPGRSTVHCKRKEVAYMYMKVNGEKDLLQLGICCCREPESGTPFSAG